MSKAEEFLKKTIENLTINSNEPYRQTPWNDVLDCVRGEVSDALLRWEFGYAAELIEELEIVMINARQ